MTGKYDGHTPGPWKDIVDSDGWLYVVGPNHEEMFYPDGEFGGHLGSICSFADMECTDLEDHANARLIADAPLLAARVEELEAAIKEYLDAIDAGMVRMPDTMRAMVIETHLRQALESGQDAPEEE